MRTFIVAALAASLAATTALAAAPLAPGKPAGLKKAQDDSNLPLYVLGAGGAIAGIVILVSGDDNGTLTTGTLSTTTST
jgi:hypothetical protein